MEFELQIAGYQFPAGTSGDYDSNWLMVVGTVRHPRGNWQFRDPCLLTCEVAELADWLEAVAANAEPKSWCGFVEPNLSFEVSGCGPDRLLRVSFAIEARSPWAARSEDVSIEFPVSALDLKAAAVSLRQQLRKFPQRGVR